MPTPTLTIPEQVAQHLPNYFQQGLASLFADGAQMQKQLLQEIVALCAQSDYAQDHGFAQITTIEDFKALVPVSDYQDYAPYIKANMQSDSGQLIALDTAYYLITTGTTGEIKYFAESTIGALARQLSIDLWNLNLAQKVSVMTQPNLKMLAVVNCAPIEQAPNGKPTLRASGQAAKVLWERAAESYVFPYEFLEATMTNDERDYLTAAYILREGHFKMIFCNNLAYFGTLLDWIEKCPQALIDDIRLGRLRAQLSERDRALLAPSFAPDAQRAAQLQALLDHYGYLPVDEVWPQLTFIGTWLSGTAGRLAKDVMCRLPDHIQYISEGYGASEAMLNIPTEYGAPYGTAAAYAYYYEFLPLDGGAPLDMTEVTVGAYYELLITSYSGLYRYNMHDIVRIHGYSGTTVNFEFCCKSTEVWHLPQRTLYGYQFMICLEEAEAACGAPLGFFQGLVEDERLSVVIQPSDSDFPAEDFWRKLKAIFARHQVPAGRLYLMEKGYYQELFSQRMVDGRTMQTIKLPLVITASPDAKHLRTILA